MRVLVELEEGARARALADALYVEGVDAHVDERREGGWAVWVHDERQLEQARELLQAFQAEPDAPRFERARREAQALRRQEKEAEKKNRHRNVDLRRRWRSQGTGGHLTLGLIALTVGVTLLSRFGANRAVTEALYFSLARILHEGEVWRVITPIFLHLGLLHLIFNMWWLKDFGTIVEQRHSPLALGAMVLTMGVLSNAAQGLLVGEAFGGMSGVVYGLFGYFWVRGRLDPTWGIALRRSTVIILVGWLVLGFTGAMQMANMAHLGGLVVGMLWGAFAAWRGRRK
ncbi:MAG: rhomboid family intramembrane serine protease [Myxococcota bacterium]